MNNLLGDKPIEFQISIDQKSAMLIGGAIFVAIAAAYFLIRSLTNK